MTWLMSLAKPPITSWKQVKLNLRVMKCFLPMLTIAKVLLSGESQHSKGSGLRVKVPTFDGTLTSGHISSHFVDQNKALLGPIK